MDASARLLGRRPKQWRRETFISHLHSVSAHRHGPMDRCCRHTVLAVCAPFFFPWGSQPIEELYAVDSISTNSTIPHSPQTTTFFYIER